MNVLDFRAARLAVAALFSFLVLAAGSHAQDAAEPPSSQEATQALLPLDVGLYVSPPFVMEVDGKTTGMAVELWETLAADLGYTTNYRTYTTIGELVDATAAGDIDVAVTNLTITQNRARRIDFTHPWFDAGLRILVDDERGASFWELVEGLRDAGHLRAYGWLVLVIVAATILITLFDRYFDPDFPRDWRHGMAESFYSVMSIATTGRSPARKNLFGWVGRIWQALWLVCGIAVLAYVTSSVTSVMTTLSLTEEINSLDDLSNQTVGVFTGSVAEEFAHQIRLETRSYANIDDAIEALLEDEIAAIVGDAPVLEYYVHTHPDHEFSVVGAIFEPDKYGFGLKQGSPLTRALTVELIGAHEHDVIEDLDTKYFGSEP